MRNLRKTIVAVQAFLLGMTTKVFATLDVTKLQALYGVQPGRVETPIKQVIFNVLGILLLPICIAGGIVVFYKMKKKKSKRERI